MVYGLEQLLERVKKGELIINLSSRELEKPEGAGFDLRVGEIFFVESGGFLGIVERDTPVTKSMAKYDENKPAFITLKKDSFYLFKTIEEIELDNDMLGIFHPRSTLFRSGIIIQTGVQPFGYKGQIVVGVYSVNDEFKIELGSRFIHLNILKVHNGQSHPYSGHWQGGRVSTTGKERQS